ncbi:MAG: hypothetical protein ABUT39_19590 [Acidobacteriota bacterium]
MSLRKPLTGLLPALLLTPALALAIAPQEEPSEEVLRSAIFSRAFTTPELEAEPSLVTVGNAQGRSGLGLFFAEQSDAWEVRWDNRSDRPNLVQGVGVPLLASDMGEDRVEVESSVRGFMADHPDLFAIDSASLRLDPERTVHLGEVWLVELQQVHKGVPVEGAHVFFRINHGNLVQFGSEKVAEVRIGTAPKITREAAFAVVLRALGADVSGISEIVSPGRLRIVPMLPSGERPGEAYEGAAGQGYRHELIWQLSFRLAGGPETWEAWVSARDARDARDGRILRLADLNDYAQVTGGVYPRTNTDAETVVGLPFLKVSPNKVTNGAGKYTYGGGTATATLDGKYVRILDQCGPISKSDSSTGNIDFGASGGADCTTPGSGGLGNTHAARSGYYHLTRINRKAAGYLPTNAWLKRTLTANMNIQAACNAFWNGSSVNFFRSGGGCSNTGEIAAVFLHEWGHGMDTNSGGAASDKGTGEAVGDTFAFLETRSACIGPNFRPGVSCYHCAPSCTGVRDVAAFAAGTGAKVAKPSTVASDAGINCDRFGCPFVSGSSPYQGPMGYEGHCESYIASAANWDLARNLVSRYGADAGWQAMEALWYRSLTPSKSAYRVASGGKCNPAARVDGCGSNNWYTVYLALDDDDGNLANGTPNGCRIWDAFNAHGIACGRQPACTK